MTDEQDDVFMTIFGSGQLLLFLQWNRLRILATAALSSSLVQRVIRQLSHWALHRNAACLSVLTPCFMNTKTNNVRNVGQNVNVVVTVLIPEEKFRCFSSGLRGQLQSSSSGSAAGRNLNFCSRALEQSGSMSSLNLEASCWGLVDFFSDDILQENFQLWLCNHHFQSLVTAAASFLYGCFLRKMLAELDLLCLTINYNKCCFGLALWGFWHFISESMFQKVFILSQHQLCLIRFILVCLSHGTLNSI